MIHLLGWQVMEQAIIAEQAAKPPACWNNPDTATTHQCCGGNVGAQTGEGSTQRFLALACSCLRSDVRAMWKTCGSAFKLGGVYST